MKPSTSGSTATIRSDSSQTSIKVIVRVRPHNEKELQDNYKTVVKIIDERMLVFDPKEEENPFFYRGVVQKGRDLLKKQNKELQFVFDRIFDTTASNVNVYEGSTKELITNLLDGYNCSVFAYGATGAGKTHTMLGKDGDPGITYRTMAELFTQIDLQADARNFNLGVSYLEIYNENVQDLLHKVGPLHLREDGRAGVIVAGLKIITIHNAEELLSLLAKGNKNRTQHATDANQESSRSHAVFQVYVNITNKIDGQVKHVKLSMIDLAGSERASATGCSGARFKEGANINKSLLALGNCINNLADGIKYIPYRDSKLTRLLKDSLGGNCQTVMIANISPSSASFEDTYNTLRYANRAKKIKTSVKKNIVSCQMHVSGYIKMVEDQKKELEILKQKLLSYENVTPPTSVTPQISINTDEQSHEFIEITNKLLELYNKKKVLNEKVLSLESSDKILYCRILYKKAADNRLHNLTAAVEATAQEEKNASGKSRVNKSLQYFKRQREGIKIQMKSAWDDLCQIEESLVELILDIKSKNLHSRLEDKISFLTSEVDTVRMQQQFEHAKKINSLQQCEMQSVSTMIKMMSSTLQNYYNMMRGGGTITEKLKQEFKQLVKSLEGIRNIKWSDLNTNKQEEDFYSTTCLSIQELENPSSSNMPDLLEFNSDDEEPLNQSPKNLLSTTFSCTPVKNIVSTTDEILNSTITISNDNVSVADDENAVIDSTKLNSTFCLPDNKSRKRVLSDSKNQVNSRSPAKQAKKISPKNRFETNGIAQNGKENNKEFPKPTMTAKSIAILNKLKADRMKPLITVAYNGDQSDAMLKAVRGKERRGLVSSHPYQKSTIQKQQQKPTSVLPSSRVPW
ncbi:PREDICTED: kinesin-like protein KIF18A [Ceratosolen solmsi marchali]|uniref:Kinesin-like protein KIF18A n=1 Tax=Ceratosolen solmsi marchali TaxID=326594 RepID=A0AAJ7DYT7_9HYME|nr:PREDICTED: kinesin-like protein KIF18A [Ceratosolen solmsi marchali]XP_011501403.1 PREDICTED: kinesin-like protein KIF18A [Ceratosolen solmsi marchali]